MSKVRKVRRRNVDLSTGGETKKPAEEAQPAVDESTSPQRYYPDPSRVEWQMSEDIDQIAAAVIAFRKTCPNLSKDKKGYSYYYVSLAQVVEVTKPLLAAQGLALVQSPVSDPGGLGVITLLLHKSGQFFRSRFIMPIPALSGTNATQDAGAAITYARRYAATAMLFMAADEDTDANYSRTSDNGPRKFKKGR